MFYIVHFGQLHKLLKPYKVKDIKGLSLDI